MTGQYIEMIFPEYDVRYIAVNDNVDTLKAENEMMIFRNVFNDFYARDCSKKVRAVLRAKGMSGKPMAANPPYGYRKSELDKDVWEIDEESAAVVRRIFRLCIEGHGPFQIAELLSSDKVLIPAAYAKKKGYGRSSQYKNPTKWGNQTVSKILENAEYLGHTINFKTYRKSFKHKKRLQNPKENWVIFEHTHPAIISQHDFDLVQEIRKQKRRPQKNDKVNIFSGVVYCADCGKPMYLNSSVSSGKRVEYFKCSTYSGEKSECTSHYIRTGVLSTIVPNELNKLLSHVHDNRETFIEMAVKQSGESRNAEIKAAKKSIAKSEKRIAEIDKLFKRLFEENVSGKLTDERFERMSESYDSEQKQLEENVAELKKLVETKEQQNSDISRFMDIIDKYEQLSDMTAEQLHELVDRIEVHEGDKSSGHRKQRIDIYFRFRIAQATVVFDKQEFKRMQLSA